MANVDLTPAMITKTALAVLHTNTVFLRSVNRQYDDRFAQVGGKIGQSINIRKPVQYYVVDQQAIDVQSSVESYTTLSLSHQWQVAMSFSTAELTLSIDEFADRYIKPAMSALSTKIDGVGLDLIRTAVYNSVGTAGYTPGTTGGTAGTMTDSSAPAVYLSSMAMLDMFNAPWDKRSVVVGPNAMARSVDGMKSLFNDQASIGEQYKSGRIRKAVNFDFMMDQNCPKLTTGSRSLSGANATVYSFSTATPGQIVLQGFNTSQTGVLKAGEVLTFGNSASTNVYSVNPESQTNNLQMAQFVVLADVNSDGSGYATVTVSPNIIAAATGVVGGTVNQVPATNTVVNFGSGAASTTYPLYGAYQQDAFTFGSADLYLPTDVDFGGRESYDGVSLRIVRQYDINSDNIPCRIDVLGGWLCQRPELANRILG